VIEDNHIIVIDRKSRQFLPERRIARPEDPTPPTQQDNESAIMPPKTMRAVVLKGDYKVRTLHAAVLKIYLPPKVPAMF
jgi:hypothetical protein